VTSGLVEHGGHHERLDEHGELGRPAVGEPVDEGVGAQHELLRPPAEQVRLALAAERDP
jgi:hypothetical protein